jgi:hypothetical protein
MAFIRRFIMAGAAAVLALGAGAASARDNIYWSVGVQAAPGVVVSAGNARPYVPPPVYYQPPVYVQPPPVYYHPRPVYYSPPPVIVAPPRYYGPPPRHWGGPPGHRQGHRHHHHRR